MTALGITLKDYAIKHPKDVSIEETCMLYRNIAELPMIDGGQILSVDNGEQLNVSCYATFSQRDLELNENRKFGRYYDVKCGTEKGLYDVNKCPVLVDHVNICCQAYSSDGKLKAIIRNKEQEHKEKQYLEIWTQCRLLKNINLSALDKHGKVYGKGTFASFAWSDDNKRILYSAERKKAKTSSYFEKKTCHNKEDEGIAKGDKFLYEEDWGEQMNDQCQPVIVICDITNESVEVLSGIPEDLSPGQACWGPDESVIFVGWLNTPTKLGLVYCTNRRSAVYQVKRTCSGNDCVQLSAGLCSVRCPRVNPQKDKVVYLERKAGGPHRGCERLMLFSFLDSTCSVVYEIKRDNPCNEGSQIGLFCGELPKRCWLVGAPHSYIILDTECGSSRYLVSVCVETGKMLVYNGDFKGSSQILLDVNEGFVLVCSSTTNKLPVLSLLQINQEQQMTDGVEYIKMRMTVDSPRQSTDEALAEVTNDIESKLTQSIITSQLPEYGLFKSILLRPRHHETSNPMPLIAWFHGGPHTSFSASFMLYPTVFCYQGFNVLLVNYRGSTGFGEASLLSLPGNIGDQDVKDCQKIVEEVVNNYNIDKKNVFAFGGSHGGYLTTHLVGQYPSYYCAAAIRNPVINIASMVDSSDIPDWCFVETVKDYDAHALLSSEVCKRMFEMSPIAHVQNITAPILILLGLKDLRVPPFQGKNLYHLLKNAGKKTKLYSYPDDCHPLSKTETEADVFIHVFSWFQENIKQ